MTAPYLASILAVAESVDLSDGDIEDRANRNVRTVTARLEQWHRGSTEQTAMVNRLRKLAHRERVALPAKAGLQALANRMTCAAWWRQALRKRFRLVEHAARAAGQVHAKASAYVSGKALRRHERNARRSLAMLEATEVVNQSTGEALPMVEVVDRSLSNPANRRAALMVRVKGVERDAIGKGHEACMLTITAPSRMHVRHRDGRQVAAWDRSDPRQVQNYLCQLWRKATRKADREGLRYCGLRTAEPHHDGTPHWHVLVFAPAADLARFVAIVRAYALADAPDEPGAAEHRFGVEHIDSSKGSALAYVSKYIGKGIDGAGIDSGDESPGSDGRSAATAITAWARVWGIRQFQFFGLPAITPVRELFRLPALDTASAGLQAAHTACRANDYAGVLGAQQAHGIGLACEREARESARYPGEITCAIRGVIASANDLAEPLALLTRPDRWVIRPRQIEAASGAPVPPWTRINNCAPSVKSTGYASAPQHQPTGTNECRRRHPPTATATAAAVA